MSGIYFNSILWRYREQVEEGSKVQMRQIGQIYTDSWSWMSEYMAVPHTTLLLIWKFL